MSLPFRLHQAARDNASGRSTQLPDGATHTLPGGGGGVALEGVDPYTGEGESVFAWDVTGQGWDEGHWYGQWEALNARLSGSLDLRRGTGPASFTRPGTTTRLNEAGGTDTVPVDTAAFDWLEGPSGTERYCLRMDQATALLTLPSSRNVSRRRGGFTVWVRPSWDGSPAEGADRVLFECGDWKLWKPAGVTELRWQVPQLDGTLKTTAYSVSGWAADTWHLIGASWDRAAGEVRLWTDGELRDTETTTLRYAELDAACGLGQGAAAGDPFGAHLLDFRVWPLALTEVLFENLFAVKP